MLGEASLSLCEDAWSNLAARHPLFGVLSQSNENETAPTEEVNLDSSSKHSLFDLVEDGIFYFPQSSFVGYNNAGS
jgi:hypothetical protein